MSAPVDSWGRSGHIAAGDRGCGHSRHALYDSGSFDGLNGEESSLGHANVLGAAKTRALVKNHCGSNRDEGSQNVADDAAMSPVVQLS
jgi:hypothetical protein